MNALRLHLCLLLLTACFYACSPLIARYNEYVYQQTTSLKVDALQLMDLAVDSFSTHKAELKELQTRLDKLYEYELHRPNNTITLEMWKTMKDSSQHLLGGYFTYWQRQHKLNPSYIEEAKQQVSAAFDKIAELESGKIKEKDLK